MHAAREGCFGGYLPPLLPVKVKAPPIGSHQIKYPQWTWGSLKQKQKKSSHFRRHSSENILRVNSVSGPQVHHYTPPPPLLANVRLWTAGWEGSGEFTGLSGLWMMVDGKNQIQPRCSASRSFDDAVCGKSWRALALGVQSVILTYKGPNYTCNFSKRHHNQP